MAYVVKSHENHPLPDRMKQNAHVAHLLAQHDELEEELREKSNELLVDWDGVKLLKRRKLAIAEQLEMLRQTMQ